jgi:hypothetical protein
MLEGIIISAYIITGMLAEEMLKQYEYVENITEDNKHIIEFFEGLVD